MEGAQARAGATRFPLLRPLQGVDVPTQAIPVVVDGLAHEHERERVVVAAQARTTQRAPLQALQHLEGGAVWLESLPRINYPSPVGSPGPESAPALSFKVFIAWPLSIVPSTASMSFASTSSRRSPLMTRTFRSFAA